MIVILLLAQIVGSQFLYTVQPGDTLTSISAQFGAEIGVLAESNGLRPAEKLRAGAILTVDNRHIAVPVEGAEIVINIPQRMLFYFENGRLLNAYPIAAGKPSWKTPLKKFEVTTLEEHPTWDVPISIQEEMRSSGKPVLTRVPPSPENPLGEYWIGLSLPGIGIHGTNAPASIYKLVTHGCIRLAPQNVQSLFRTVRIGMQGRIVYEPVLLARIGDSVFAEAHPDAYRKDREPMQRVLESARALGVYDMLDVSLVQEVLRKRDGVARDVTLR